MSPGVAPFVALIIGMAAWLLTALIIVLQLAGVRWARRNRQRTPTQCAALVLSPHRGRSRA